jgi:hypothetical protein
MQSSLRRIALRVAVTLMTFFALQDAHAAEHWISSTIKAVYTQSTGSFILVFNTQYGAPPCNSQPQYFYVTVGENGVTAEGVKSLLATSLAAASQHQTVEVAFDDTTSQCYVNRVWVYF